MSFLGYVSAHLEREERLLEALSKATFVLQAESLGLGDRLGLTVANVSGSRNHVSTMASRLVTVLASDQPQPDVDPIISRILQSSRPVSDWAQDLQLLANATAAPGPLPDEVLRTLSSILRFLNVSFTEELYRVYGRR